MAVIDEGIHVVDRQGVSVLYNKQAGQSDGLTADEVIGRHLLEVFPSLTEATSTLLKVLATGHPIVNQEQTFTNYKGSLVTTINSTFPILDGERMVGAIEVSKDVTRVRELSEQVVDLQAELLRKRRRRSTAWNEARYALDDLIGHHPLMQMVKQRAIRAAHGTSPVLIYGETGTGKEILVHAIHQASQRHAHPLVAQNCAALPEGLLESILFGTVRGSFTGAEDRPGLFELADGGTLYLDEINSMNPELQAKLLRVLQDGRIRRVGDTAERRVDVRVVASTNEEPLVAVEQRRLRRDLFYRLNVVYIELPPLRERRSDIPLLAAHFLKEYGHRFGLSVRGFSLAVERLFMWHEWPGNVRELQHALEAAVQMASGDELHIADLPSHLQRIAHAAGDDEVDDDAGAGVVVDPQALRSSLAVLEREAVGRALADSGWNLSQAARLLGIPRQTLQYRIKVLGLTRPDEQA